MIGQHLNTQQLQTLGIGLNILEGHEGEVQGVHMGHHAHCKSCHTEAFAVPVFDNLRVSQAPLRLALLGTQRSFKPQNVCTDPECRRSSETHEDCQTHFDIGEMF